MSIKRRLDRLEERAGVSRRLLVLTQDLKDRSRFTDNEGNEYREGVNWPEGAGVTVLKVVHDR